MGALKWSLMALAALLGSSAHRLTPIAAPAPIWSSPIPTPFSPVTMSPDIGGGPIISVHELHQAPPRPPKDEKIASKPFVQPPSPVPASGADDSAAAVNCCRHKVPKNAYYCQPAGHRGSSSGGAGFTIYLGDQLPSASGDGERKP